IFKDFFVPEVVVIFQDGAGQRAANHGLEDQFAPHLLDDLIKSKERIAQVIEDPHKENVVESSWNFIDVINGELLELDLQFEHLGGKFCLVKIPVVNVHGQHPLRAALFQLDRVKTPIASQVEHGGAREIFGKNMSYVFPFHLGKIPQKMVGRRLNAFEIDVVKPLAKFGDAAFDSG